MKKIVCIMLAAVMALGMLCGCGSSASNTAADGTQQTAAKADAIKLKIGHNCSDDQAISVAIKWMADEISTRTDGAVDISVYGNNLLGSEAEMRDMVSEGTLDMCSIGLGGLTAWSPAADLCQGLYLFESGDELLYVAEESDFGKENFYDKLLADWNVRTLDQWMHTYRQLISNKKVESLDDLKGLKVRTPSGNAVFENSWADMGALVVQMSLGDCFTAVQQGAIDGVELPIDFIYNYQLMESCKYLTRTNHVISTQFILINEDVWETIPAEYQETILAVCDEAKSMVDELNTENTAKFEQSLQDDYGVTICDLDEDSRVKAAEICGKVITEEMSRWGQDTYDSLQAALDEYRSGK